MTAAEAQEAAQAQLEEQFLRNREAARIAEQAAEDAKYEADCLVAAARR